MICHNRTNMATSIKEEENYSNLFRTIPNPTEWDGTAESMATALNG